MEALKARLEETKDGISRGSTLVKAIDYALERWAGLTLFLEDGRLEPDTNIVERSIRPIGIGKKNSLFCGNDEGASYCSPHHVFAKSSKFCCRGSGDGRRERRAAA
jgi:hypothetical protein